MPRLLIRWLLWAVALFAAMALMLILATAATFAATEGLGGPEEFLKVTGLVDVTTLSRIST